MKKIMESINKNKTWDLMDLLVGKKSILGKWVYKLKQGLCRNLSLGFATNAKACKGASQV
jgi:hypothetical protein